MFFLDHDLTGIVIEYCFLYSKGKSKIHIKDQPNFFKDTKDKVEGHPTVKPKKMFKWLIKNSTDEGDLVLDNTMGSCSTGEACINTNRNFIGIEKDEKYFNIAKERIENHKKESDNNYEN